MSDPWLIELIVGELDSSSQFYSETTAREARPIGPYAIDVLATIASVAGTRSAGCTPIARAGSANDVPFCEIGRNYRYDQQQLDAVHPVVIGFATVRPSALKQEMLITRTSLTAPSLKDKGGS
jgi:hypothetical protein